MEGTHFSESQVMYLLSRLRSEAESDSFAMISCNPDPDSWLYKWVEWYLDEEGFPIRERSGKKRYYITVDDTPVFADSPEELKRDYPDLCQVYNPNEDEYIEIEPKSFTFISGTIFDNPILIKSNPKYLAELKSLPRVERARFLDGNWKARPEGSNYFQRDWLKKIDKVPSEAKTVRAWDKASTEPSEKNRSPDYTTSIKISKCKNGYYYIQGGWIPETKEEGSDIWGRFRKRPGERDTIITKQSKYDGDGVICVLPKDPGAAGQVEYEESAKRLVEEGIVVRADPMPSNNSKLTRFEPFSSAAQNGLVYIVENSFPNKATLEWYLGELEAFTGERSTAQRKDDAPDATASGFNYLSKEKVIGAFSLGVANINNKQTLARSILDSGIPNRF